MINEFLNFASFDNRIRSIIGLSEGNPYKWTIEPTHDRPSTTFSHSYTLMYKRASFFFFFQTFQLISHWFIARERKGVQSLRRKRDFMIFANLSEEKRSYTFCQNVFGFCPKFYYTRRDISFVKSNDKWVK